MLYSVRMDLKSFLFEKKNQRLLLLGVAIFIVLVSVLTIVLPTIIKPKEPQKKPSEQIILIPSPTKTFDQTNDETIQSLGLSIDCQLVVTTSKKKLFVKKLDKCQTALDYKISPSKKYASYISIDKNKTSQLFVYSLDNNVSGQLQIISQPIITSQFDSRNNLVILLSDRLVYYFIPILFSGYPGNYYKELNTFTDVDKRRIEIPFSDLKITSASIVETQNGLLLTDFSGKTLYTIGFSNLDAQLSPTQSSTVDKRLLNWSKRIFFFSGQEFKTMDMDGSNKVTYQFICDGIEVIPIEFRNNLMARSPDGQTLAFLVPTEAQMKENPNWKNNILAGKKVFDRGELVLYDFVKSDCQKTGIVQSIQFREMFSFSPNGQYIGFVNKGVSVYNLQNHQDYQLVVHDPERDTDNTAATGPLVWNGTSKFIYTLVSKITNGTISSTKLVRIYFDERFNGVEQELFSTSNDVLYAVSSDGSKVLYTKDKQLYKYDVDRRVNSLFSNDSVDKITKIVWLRNGTVVSNLWYANENLYFTKLSVMRNFQIDFDGNVIVYTPIISILPNPTSGSLNPIYLYDFDLKRQKFFKDKQTIQGDILQMYY